MALGEAVRIRLNESKRLQYEDEAQARDQTLPEYLRERLNREDVVLDAIADLRHELEEVRAAVGQGQPQGGIKEGGSDSGMMLEILLLLRSIAGPEKVKFAKGEVRRQGFNVTEL